jgi:hypothetical protein
VVEDLPPGTLVGLVVYGSEPRRLTPSLTADHARVAALIDEVQPTLGTSNLRGALLEARRLLGGEPGEVLLYSDEAGPRQITSSMEELARLVEAGSTLIPRTVAGDPARNVAVTSAVYGDGIEGGQVTLRVTNFGPDAIEVACAVVLPDGATIPIFADVPPQGEAEERITVPREALGGVGMARCDDPDLPNDDARYFHLPRIGAARVLVVDGDPGDTPTRSEVYFLERALAPDVTAPLGLMALDSETHRVVFLANLADPRPFGPRLTEFVRRGGSLVISAGDNVTADRYNAALGAILPAPFRKTRALTDITEGGIQLTYPDADHPLFEPFRRGGRTGFAKVRSHRVLTLEPYEDNDEVTTLLRYEGGMPALVERKVGLGRVMVWTGTFDLAWGNAPLQAVYMPLMQRLVSYLGGESGGSEARFDAQVGERVSFTLPDLVLEPVVLGPNREEVRSRIEGSTLIFTPEKAGPYELHLESAPPLAWVAANTDPLESDVRPYDSVAAAEAAINPELFIRTVDLVRWFLAFALGCFCISSVMSLRGAVI